MTKPSRPRRIADLNDSFRRHLATGRVQTTVGFKRKPPRFIAEALARVIAFDDFNADNDPHSEHDFGSFELEDETVYWCIDYYDPAGIVESKNPADPKTLRVLTIVLAKER